MMINSAHSYIEEELRNGIVAALFEKMVPIRVELPYSEGALIALFHDQGVVDLIDSGRGSVIMTGMIPGRYITQYQPFFVDEESGMRNEE